MGKQHDIYDISLRNVSGVPVIDVVGVLNRASLGALEKTIGLLTSAGHFNIVINVKRVIAPNLSALESLADSVKRVRGHYGVVELVAEAGQIAQVATVGTLSKLFRFCISESQAFQRIKGLMRPDDSFLCAPAHLRETS